MRKFIILLCSVLCTQLAFTQRSEQYISKNRLFYEGKTMYNDENYAGCIDKLKEYRKTAQEAVLIQETDFLLLASLFKQGRADLGLKLKDFLDTYPETIHYDEVCFMIGSSHFEQKDYKVAIYWFEKANLDNLPVKMQEDYAYRMALSCLETNKKTEALRLFSLLKNNSFTYKEAAIYYMAYLHYTDGEYDKALPLFNNIKNKKEFQQDVLYYLTQINFIQGRYTQSIKEGLSLLSNYPQQEKNTEINRIIGNAYFYESDFVNTTKYLTQYAKDIKEPSGNDLYTLGLSFYNLKNYKSAVEYLNRTNPQNDALGQSIYLFLGQSYLNIGDNKNALMSFESASRMNYDPQAKEAAMYNYAMLLHKNAISAFGESVTVLENFLNTYPNSIYADKVNDCLVQVYLTTKNYNTALQSIEKIKNPGKKIWEAKQKIYYHLGTIQFVNTDYSNAINYFTKTIAAGNYAEEEKENAVYWRAESYYRQENYDAAIKDYHAYMNTTQSNGNLSIMSNYNLGYCYFKKGQYAAAQSAFTTYAEKETSKTKTNLADAYARLGDCHFYNRKFAEAENAYSQSATLQPQFADYPLFQKAFVLGLQKDYKGKITQLDKLLNSYPESRYLTDALYEKGRAYVMLENNQAAIQTYEILLGRYPENSNARKAGLQMGLLHFNSNEPQKAAAAYKKVIEKYPGSEEAKVAIQDLKSVYFDLNDVEGYANYVNSLGGLVKFEVSEQDSLTYLAAEQCFMKNDIKRAQEMMQKYLQSFPDGVFGVNAHYYLACIHANKKELSQAKSEFSKVLETGNNKFTEESLIRLAELQYTDGEFEQALLSYQHLQNVAESKSNHEQGLVGAMRSAGKLNKYPEMLNSSNALLKETKDTELISEATYHRAKAFLGLNEKTKALPELQILSKDTRTVYGAEAKYLLAQYYFDNKEADKAEAEVLNYIQKGTPHAYWLARGFILLSDVYKSKNDPLQAKQYLESLQHNYKNTGDDIHLTIKERMAKINQK